MGYSRSTASLPVQSSSVMFNDAGDQMYGYLCCLCFLVGTIGNIVSFLYFRSKKREISSVIYMMITANDILVSMTVLPVGISFLSKRKPGLVFGNQSGCVAWLYLWEMTISFSIFLVIKAFILLLKTIVFLALILLFRSVLQFLVQSTVD